MSFDPYPGQTLIIKGQTFTIAEHPQAAGIPYGQEGRAGTVFQLSDSIQTYALKVFKPKFRVPVLVTQSDCLNRYASLPGLRAAHRSVLEPLREPDLLRTYPDLTYAVLMPWISGSTWCEVLLERKQLSVKDSLVLARSLLTVLMTMEQQGLAHCDLSGANVLLPTTEGIRSVELVDLEGMYASDLARPNKLSCGSAGYAHIQATTGLWSSEADRFAGAVLTAEMLGWCDATVVAKAYGESFFDKDEMQQPSERAEHLQQVLARIWGESVAELWQRAWKSETLAECPTFGEWLVALSPSEMYTLSPSAIGNSKIPSARSTNLQSSVEPVFDKSTQHSSNLQNVEPSISINRPSSNKSRKRFYAWQRVFAGVLLLMLIITGYFFVIYNQTDNPFYPVAALTPFPIPDTSITPDNAAKLAEVARWGKGVINQITVDPTGQLLAVATPLGIYLYDYQTLDEKYIIAEQYNITSISFSSDGKMIASGSDDNNVRVWQVSDGKLLKTFVGHTNWIRSVAFDPTDTILASGSDDGTIRLWKIDDGTVLNSLKGHISSVWSLSFSPDGTILASGGFDFTVRTWRISDGALLRTLEGHTGRILTVAFSSDGDIIASGSDDRTVRLWRVNDGVQLNVFNQDAWITSVVFWPDSQVLAVGSWDSKVYLWRINDGTLLDTLERHKSSVLSLTSSPDSTSLVSASADGDIYFWHFGNVNPLRSIEAHTSSVLGVAFSPDNTTLVSGNWDSTVSLWKVIDSTPLQRLEAHRSLVRSVAFSSDGRTFASGSDDGTVRIWQVGKNVPLQVLNGHTGRVLSVAFSLDGRILASGGDDGKIYLWQVSDASLLKVLEGDSSSVRSVTISPSGSFVVSGGDDGQVRIWDLESGSVLRVLKHPSPINSVAFSSDGSILATGSDDNSVRLWRVNNGTLLHTLVSHSDKVLSLAFSPENAILASCGMDYTIRLWRVRDGSLLHILKSHTHWCRALDFAPNGTMLASGSEDGTIRIWAIP